MDPKLGRCQSGPMDPAVRAYLEGISSPKRRRDAETMVDLMRHATGEEPKMWGSIVGFGAYHYKYESGREGDSGAAGFAARKTATTVYVADGVGGTHRPARTTRAAHDRCRVHLHEGPDRGRSRDSRGHRLSFVLHPHSRHIHEASPRRRYEPDLVPLLADPDRDRVLVAVLFNGVENEALALTERPKNGSLECAGTQVDL